MKRGIWVFVGILIITIFILAMYLFRSDDLNLIDNDVSNLSTNNYTLKNEQVFEYPNSVKNPNSSYVLIFPHKYDQNYVAFTMVLKNQINLPIVLFVSNASEIGVLFDESKMLSGEYKKYLIEECGSIEHITPIDSSSTKIDEFECSYKPGSGIIFYNPSNQTISYDALMGIFVKEIN